MKNTLSSNAFKLSPHLLALVLLFVPTISQKTWDIISGTARFIWVDPKTLTGEYGQQKFAHNQGKITALEHEGSSESQIYAFLSDELEYYRGLFTLWGPDADDQRILDLLEARIQQAAQSLTPEEKSALDTRADSGEYDRLWREEFDRLYGIESLIQIGSTPWWGSALSREDRGNLGSKTGADIARERAAREAQYRRD